jgi:hypothetical protein
MKRILFFLSIFIFNFTSAKEPSPPDTVTVGFYINSVHNINFKDKEYTINLWLWLKYRNPDFDFSKYLEVPMAKTVDKSFYTVDTLDDGRIYMLMKLQCVMRDSWKIQSFPFDRQKLRFTIENSQYDSRYLVFAEDTLGNHYSKWTIPDWCIVADSFKITTGIKKYETGFGDPGYLKPQAQFATYRAIITLERDSWGLFLKLFIGMYISFMLSVICFFIHNDHMDSRFSLSVGSLFAVIGNKYVIDSSLPESTTFTLVDTLHGLTLLFILTAVACSIRTLSFIKDNQMIKAINFDRRACLVLVLTYVLLNLFFIIQAYHT